VVPGRSEVEQGQDTAGAGVSRVDLAKRPVVERGRIQQDAGVSRVEKADSGQKASG